MTQLMTFTPSNRLTFDTVAKDSKRLLSFFNTLSSEISSFTINLEHVKQCDSAGLAFLIEAKRLARDHKKKCMIKCIDGHVLALAKFCGVENIL